MGFDDDLRDFANICRLFPLPGVVLFPHAVLPLHIFEPRYLQMTEDALASDHLVTIVQARASSAAELAGDPPVEEVACLGKILNHERLPDGRFNFLLLGRKRVRLIREIPRATKLYRQAEVEILEDEYPDGSFESKRLELTTLFLAISEREDALDPDLEALLKTSLPLGILTDIIAHAMGFPPAVKQAFLADCRVDHRADNLILILRQWTDRELVPESARRPFPPPFSEN